MRERHIKLIAHWVVMTFVLLFPIVLMGLSAFDKTEGLEKQVNIQYKYETNDIENTGEFISGNYYYFDYEYYLNNIDVVVDMVDGELSINAINENKVDYNDFSFDFGQYSDSYVNDVANPLYEYGLYIQYTSGDDFLSLYIGYFDSNVGLDYVFYDGDYCNFETDFVALFETDNPTLELIRCLRQCPLDMMPIESVEIVETGKPTFRDDLNSWCSDFVNMDLNSWYVSLCNVMGFNLVFNSALSVIYIYPLYVIWVYCFDLITDLFLVIVKLGHNLLERLGGDNL